MNPAEFVLYYVYIPWSLALIGVASTVFLIVMGGGTLRTIIMGKLDKRTHFALSISDGGSAELKRYHFDGVHGILERDREYLPFATPLSDKFYQPNLLTAKTDATEEQRKAIDEENKRRIAEANRLNVEVPMINDLAKKRSFLEGRPLWLVHMGKNVAETPSMVYAQQKASESKRGATVTPVEVLSVDAIKEFVNANFSRERLWTLVQKGRDIEAYGRPKKPMNPMIIILGAVAIIFIVGGALILSGKLDFTPWLKQLGVMK